jgi:hypothetical protein
MIQMNRRFTKARLIAAAATASVAASLLVATALVRVTVMGRSKT